MYSTQTNGMYRYGFKDASDKIILESVESYMSKLGAQPANMPPQEKLLVYQQMRDALYSDIVHRIPRLAPYLMEADMETDLDAQGLWFALSKHVMDPIFINLLMQYLARENNPQANGIVGALLVKFVSRYIMSKAQVVEKPVAKTDDKGKDKKNATTPAPVETEKKIVVDPKDNMAEIAHLNVAIKQLLGDIEAIISCRCNGLTEIEIRAVAACIAMNSQSTIIELIASDLPVTADLLNIVADPSNLIRGALLFEKCTFPKYTTNQKAFVDSLTRWVYDKLNCIPTQTSYQFLVATYGSPRPDVSKYVIQIKDCGTQYPNLLTVAKQMIN